MKKHQPKNIEEIKSLLKYLNSCHDASMKRICFGKDRDINQDGDLDYPFEDVINGDVEIELILNSYQGAKRDQRVLLQFKDVRIFNFYSTAKKVKSLSIICNQIVCIEK